MIVLKITLLLACAALSYAQQGPTTTPVPILKQINRQNDDGSYSFGYEAADGSFKIETKYPSGDVAGKYGYVDDNGKLREISYGASSKRGFEPQGSGIMVPPPTLNDPSSTNALTDGQEDDGQYREDPKIYEDPKYNGKASKLRPSPNFSFQAEPAQFTQQTNYQPSQRLQTQTQQYQPSQRQQIQAQPQQYQPSFRQNNLFSQEPQQFDQEYRPQSQIYHQQPQFSYQGYTPQPQPQYQPSYNQYTNQAQAYNPFQGHPATNFDPSTGSYTINFTG